MCLIFGIAIPPRAACGGVSLTSAPGRDQDRAPTALSSSEDDGTRQRPARRRLRVRAAFRAASLATPARIRVAAPRCAAAFGERSVPRRCRAERFACRESAVFDAAPRLARRNAFDTA